MQGYEFPYTGGAKRDILKTKFKEMGCCWPATEIYNSSIEPYISYTS